MISGASGFAGGGRTLRGLGGPGGRGGRLWHPFRVRGLGGLGSGGGRSFLARPPTTGWRPLRGAEDGDGGFFGPAGFGAAFALAGDEEVGGIGFAAGADEGVAAGELEAEPGDEGRFVDGVEPKGNLGEFNGGGVEIDAEDVVVGEEHFHPLPFAGVVLVGDGLAEFSLLFPQVGFGELVDGFVEEGGGADGHLADGEVEDLVGVEALQALLEGVFDEAAGERLGGVVGGGFFPGAPGEAVDEPALFVAQEGVGAVDFLKDALVVGVVLELGGGDEVGVFERVVILAGGFDLEEFLLGEEAGVGEQVFVDGPELVDAEGGVGDAAGAGVAAASGIAERQAADDALEDVVAEFATAEIGGAFGIEKMALERGDFEVPVDGLLAVVLEREGIAPGVPAALEDEAEKGLYRIVEEIAVAHLVGLQLDHFKVAQGFDGVALEVFLGFDWQVAEFGPGFEVEAEKEAVEVAQAAAGEFVFELFVGLVEEGFLADVAEVPDGFVGDVLDGVDEGVLEILGDGEGVLVGGFVEAVEEREAVGRAGGIAVEEGGGGAEGGLVAAVEDFPQVEGEEAALGPLHAISEDDLAEGEEDHPAGRFGQAEDVLAEDFLPGGRDALCRPFRARIRFRRGTQGVALGYRLSPLRG